MVVISALLTAAQLFITNNSKKIIVVSFLCGVIVGMVAC